MKTTVRERLERRQFVALSGVDVFAGLSGCSRVYGRLSDTPQTPDGMSVETEHWPGGHVEHRDPKQYPFAVVATSVSEATDELSSPETNREGVDPIEFIEQTDFDTSYLVLIQWGHGSSGLSLELDRIERRDFGLHVEATVVEPAGDRTGDSSTHSLFVRVTDERDVAAVSATLDVRDTRDTLFSLP